MHTSAWASLPIHEVFLNPWYHSRSEKEEEKKKNKGGTRRRAIRSNPKKLTQIEPMSLLSKLSVCASVLVSIGIIALVHNKQEADRVRLHQGVLIDQERQARKRQNLQDMKDHSWQKSAAIQCRPFLRLGNPGLLVTWFWPCDSRCFAWERDVILN